MTTHYWVSTVIREHVLLGVAGGYFQRSEAGTNSSCLSPV